MADKSVNYFNYKFKWISKIFSLNMEHKKYGKKT